MMRELLESDAAAKEFIAFNINEEAETIAVTKNANGTYFGETTFDDDGPVPKPASAAAAKTTANGAIDAGAARIDVTLDADGKYTVVST